MLKSTFIARSMDGLILVESVSEKADKHLEHLKIKAKELMSKGVADETMQSADIEDHRFQ
jgi:hypothetical protein